MYGEQGRMKTKWFWCLILMLNSVGVVFGYGRTCHLNTAMIFFYSLRQEGAVKRAYRQVGHSVMAVRRVQVVSMRRRQS
jgi:hypothetical protein